MADNALPSSVPVLITGGGPVGLSLACELGRRGVEVLLIERRGEKLGSARMIEVGVRTMEICRQLGVTEDIWRWGFPHDHSLDSVFVTHLDGYELGRVKMPTLRQHRSSEFSPERPVPCPQTYFDPILKRRAQSFPSVKLAYKTRLESFEQDSEGVTALLVDSVTGGTRYIRAQYLVGCDGSDSLVRERLGIQVRGQRHLDWSLNIYLTIPNFQHAHRTAPAFRYVFVGPDGTWSFLTMIDGKDSFRLQLIGVDKEALEQTDVAAMVRRCFGRNVPFTIDDKILWVRKMTTADRFSDGLVFLAGDAAHAHPPNGGLGMNIGIQDAFDLGWKLAARLQGWGGDTLLESYDYERRPAASRANEVSLANYRRLTENSRDTEIETDTEAGAAARRRVGENLVRQNTRSWLPPGVHLGHIYHSSPIVASDGLHMPEDDTFEYVPTTFPGARAPHAWLGPQTSILDLFGQGFTLLQFDDCTAEPLRRAAALRSVPLTVHRIRNPATAQLYQRKLVLVRPDGHVAWRGDALPDDCTALIDLIRGAGLRVGGCRTGDRWIATAAELQRRENTRSPNVVSYPSAAARTDRSTLAV